MKFVKSVMLSALILASTLASKPSQAAVGVAFASPVAVIVGIALVGGSGTGMYFALTRKMGPHGLGSLALGIVSLAAGCYGLLILDEEQSIAFAPVDAEAAHNLGMSAAEMNSYNAEIDQVNSMVAHVDQTIGVGGTAEQAASVWNEIKDAVNPLTFSALVKITQQ